MKNFKLISRFTLLSLLAVFMWNTSFCQKGKTSKSIIDCSTYPERCADKGGNNGVGIEVEVVPPKSGGDPCDGGNCGGGNITKIIRNPDFLEIRNVTSKIKFGHNSMKLNKLYHKNLKSNKSKQN